MIIVNCKSCLHLQLLTKEAHQTHSANVKVVATERVAVDEFDVHEAAVTPRWQSQRKLERVMRGLKELCTITQAFFQVSLI